MTQDIVTNGGGDYGYQLCKCSECGVVRHCTPQFDFYVRESEPDNGPLVCEPCLLGGLKVVAVIGGNPNN